MRFSKLHLENWRNFTSVDVSLQQRMFLIGANASGKSNLLDVFRFLRDVVRVGGGFEKAILDRGGIARLQSLFATGSPEIVIDVAIGDNANELWRYRLAFVSGHDDRPILREEKVWKAGVLLLERPDEQDVVDEELLHQTQLEQSKANRKFRAIADFFNSIRYYHIVPQIVREPERSAGMKADPYGSDFLEQIARLPLATRQARLQQIERVLRIAVPQFQNLELDRDIHGSLHFFGKHGPERASAHDAETRTFEAWQTENDFSDGTLRLIGLLWALLDGAGPLLLEEPELSLHPEIVRRLVGLMWSIQKEQERQILVSTHSDALLRDEGIAPDEILILLPTADGTQVKVGTEVEVVQQLMKAGLTAAEAALPGTGLSDAEKLAFLKQEAE